jgi:hypothetical protein
MRSCALATKDRRTAIVTFKQQLPITAGPHKLTRFRTTGQLVPELDAHFQGITPLASPWCDETALGAASKGTSTLATWLSYLPVVSWFSPASSTTPSLLLRSVIGNE